VLHSERGSALARVTPDKSIRLVRGDREAFGIHGRSAEQRVASTCCWTRISASSPSVDAPAPAVGARLCAGLEAVSNGRRTSASSCSWPLYAVGGQDLGYLPAARTRRWRPGRRRVFRHARRAVSRDVVDEVLDRDMLEVLPLTHIRDARCTTPS